jgi:hypothetical protein
MDIAISLWVWHAQPLANPFSLTLLPRVLADGGFTHRLMSGCCQAAEHFFLVTVLCAFHADVRFCNFVSWPNSGALCPSPS